MLAIIPAREGSKGVPNKNVRKIAGKPLIEYTINEAKKSKKISRIVVTSDSDQILKIANNLGIESIKRPKKYAKDSSPMVDVLVHLLSKKKYSDYESIILLQPTCPLRTHKDIDLAIEAFFLNNADSLVSVVKVEDCHPARMYKIESNRMISILPEYSTSNRQDLPVLYLRNGSIYIAKKKIINGGNIWGGNIFPYLMDKLNSLNIDDLADFNYAKYLIETSK